MDALASLGQLSKPATVLIERVSDAIGGVFRPHQIRRLAQAEADAARITAVAQIEVSQLQVRAMHRFLLEEEMKQKNIEDILTIALPQLAETSLPEKVQEDWINKFFQECRIISDKEMQKLWARLLASESNTPGRYSKRTINLLASMDKADAKLFESLCVFAWEVRGKCLIILNANDSIYQDAGITFETLHHLDLMGLIRYSGATGFVEEIPPGDFTISYFTETFRLTGRWNPFGLSVGEAMFTLPGKELASISSAQPNLLFRDYVLWKFENELPNKVKTIIKVESL